ncbi:CDP-glycerol glycerophosphotransferase family protein [Phycicoccus sp. M110.8]|uniref:CDP-glycerol glycerophosphotransferase family protein n=1 Tax=Phycicoccus sp. M110.8 TaxID=3075433 RepID=UPI0028FCFF86|nr:CDP-glycerol glycerophosphotransferase family protein [Phycicoccus sp. M110.8]MDU0312705.1 CDP-glycerol glycerophosphotransferase family protein [Phycicoccus sp. M110.8]
MIRFARLRGSARRGFEAAGDLAGRARLLATDRVLESRHDGLRVRGREESFDVVLFFSAEPAQLYQATMWLGPLEELARHVRVAVLCRQAGHAIRLASMTGLPVRMSRRAEECNGWLTRSGVALVVYVNQNTQNFQTLRLPRPAHAHLSHGESEKVSMVSNQLKAYDLVFTAGPAARHRILENLFDFDPAAFVDVGRPQVDVHDAVRHLPSSDRVTVLYAPTWEGDSPAMAYGSVASQGEAIAAAVLQSSGHRLVYRPHPQTGRVSAAARRADRAIRTRIERAAAADPAAGHRVDTSSVWGWQLDEADQCICDVSAVAFDWLATGKPILLTAAKGDARSVGPTTARLPRLSVDETPRVLELLSSETDLQHRQALAALVEHHFGDTTPGSSMRRFVQACTDAVTHRRSQWGEG